MNKYFTSVALLVMSFIFSNTILAWPVSLDFSNDLEGDAETRKQITFKIGVDDLVIPRCDVEQESGNSGVTEDPYCHRYGLVWAPALAGGVMEQQIDWNPELDLDVDDKFRLPTIKELIRLVDYDNSDSSRGFTDNLIQYWLENKCDDSDGDSISCLQQNVTLASGGVSLKDGYLISSTYVDIDGSRSNKSDGFGFAQILGVRVKDGQVVMFESGPKGDTFDGKSKLALCLGLKMFHDGEEEQVSSHCDYRVNGDDTSNTLQQAADLATVPVFALLVKEIETP